MTDDLFYFDEDKAALSSSLTLTGGGSLNMMGSAMPSAKPLLFDVSWEVCRKVGGIYTVMTSKARVTVSEWGDRYGLIGPWSEIAYREFEEIPPSKISASLIQAMKEKYGIKVYFGRWLVKGYPKVFLLDLNSSAGQLGKWRDELMASFANPNDTETNDAIIFGNQVALLFMELNRIMDERPIVAHFHEWLTGVGLIRLKQMNVRIATLFTTHATLLGRYMASGRVDLYNVIEHTNSDQEAGKRGIYHRHWIEAGAARGSDIFTTVSEITGYEAEYALGIKPHVITPNGLIVDKFVALHEFQVLHRKSKDKISEFIRGHFYGPNLDFDIDKTLYLFTAGRHEYYNKGVDLYIEALAQLNHQLKESKSDITVVAFIIMPGKANNYNVESIKGQSLRRDVSDTCTQITKHIRERMYQSLIKGEIPDPKDFLSEEDVVTLKRRAQALQQNSSLPPIVTHNMSTDDDEILHHLRRCNLVNNREDRVKVIYHPEFLNINSPLFPIDYNDFVRGCHMGVFPSYYEPWGYTPAECLVMGVPSISSNLTGFANYISSYVHDPEEHGVFIVDRRTRSFNDTKYQMADMLWRFTQLSRRQRIELRNKTESLSYLLDWNVLGKYYWKARKQALQLVYGIEIPCPKVFSQNEDNSYYDPTTTDTIEF